MTNLGPLSLVRLSPARSGPLDGRDAPGRAQRHSDTVDGGLDGLLRACLDTSVRVLPVPPTAHDPDIAHRRRIHRGHVVESGREAEGATLAIVDERPGIGSPDYGRQGAFDSAQPARSHRETQGSGS